MLNSDLHDPPSMLPPTATCHTVDNGVMATPVVSRYAGAVAPASLIPSLCSFHPPRRSSLETTSSLGVVRNSVEDCVQFTSYLNSFSFYSLESRVSFHFFSLKSFGKTHQRSRVYSLPSVHNEEGEVEGRKGEGESLREKETDYSGASHGCSSIRRYHGSVNVAWKENQHHQCAHLTGSRACACVCPVLTRKSAFSSGFHSDAGLLTVPGVPSTAQSGGRPRVQRDHPLPSARIFHAERLCLLEIHDALTGVEGGRSG